MYSKVYTITCDEGQGSALMSHYDAVVAPAIRESEHHVGHQMVEVGDEEWILVSDYRSADAADEAGDLVRELVVEMSAKFGMKLDVIGEGEVSRQVS
jgi:hypothetical protein